VTHGQRFTQLQILLYTVLLGAVSVLPFVIRMSGWVYLCAAILLALGFTHHAWKLYRDYSDRQARATFNYSLFYLAALFAALLADHYAMPILVP